MTYIDPTDTGTGASVAVETDAGLQSSISNLVIDGTDYILFESSAGLEVYTIDPETCELTFHQHLDTIKGEGIYVDQIRWANIDGQVYGVDTGSDTIPSTGNAAFSVYSFDYETNMFTVNEVALDDVSGDSLSSNNEFSTAYIDENTGEIVAYVHNRFMDDTVQQDLGVLERYVYDTTTETWSLDQVFSSEDYNRPDIAALVGQGEVIQDPTTGTYYMIGTPRPYVTGADTKGIEIIKLDPETGLPVSSVFISDNDLPGGDLTTVYQDRFSGFLFTHGDIEFDSAGNLVLVNNDTTTPSGGIAVVDPDTGTVIWELSDGEVDPITGESWRGAELTSGGDIVFSEDGRYMYYVGQNEGNGEENNGTYTVVVDTQYPLPDGSTTYAVVDAGVDTDAGRGGEDPVTGTIIFPDGVTPGVDTADSYPFKGASTTNILTLSNGKTIQVDIGDIDTPSRGNVINISETNLDDGAPDLVVPCFVAGTKIMTIHGEIEVEDLDIGDLVLTADEGYQPVRWVGITERDADGSMAPIVFKEGAIGNSRELRFSPQHRILATGLRVQLMFDQAEVLVPAKAMVNDKTIYQAFGGKVTYVHLMFDKHQIVFTGEVKSESFMPGHVGLDALSEDTRKELFDLFPQLEYDLDSYGAPARSGLTVREGKFLSN